MKIISDFKNLKIKNPVITIGTFDGLHIGHSIVLQKLKSVAKIKNGQTVVFSFLQHPRLVLKPDDALLKLLSTYREKVEILEDMGIDYFYTQHFTKEFSQLSTEEFVENYLVDKFKINTLIIGYDHQLGKNREGTKILMMQLAEKFNFEIIDVYPCSIESINVSSTKIRNLLSEGNILTANLYLGRNYSISGKVVQGRQLGRTLGFPTANLEIDDALKQVPANGVYVAEVNYLNTLYGAMVNIGKRPTFQNSFSEISIEVHIFDFNKDIYNQSITVVFYNKMRDEVKFENISELKNQLITDKQNALLFLSKK